MGERSDAEEELQARSVLAEEHDKERFVQAVAASLEHRQLRAELARAREENRVLVAELEQARRLRPSPPGLVVASLECPAAPAVG